MPRGKRRHFAAKRNFRTGKSAEHLKQKHKVSDQKSRIIAPETDVTLTYVECANLTLNGGGGVARRWTPNGAYDVDPVLGSTATPGFDEYAVFYDYYRVTSYRYEIDVANKEAFPLVVIVLNTNTDPGTTITNWVQYSAQEYCSSKILSATTGGSDSKTFRGAYTVAQVLGSIVPETDDLYSALTSAVPADLIWLGLGIDVPGNTVLFTDLGIDFNIKIYMNIRFYGRKIGLLTLQERMSTDRDEERKDYKKEHAKRVRDGYFTDASIRLRRREKQLACEHLPFPVENPAPRLTSRPGAVRREVSE